MPTLLVRDAVGERFYPQMSVGLFGSGDGDSKTSAGAQVLAASGSRLGITQRYLGSNLKPRAEFTRLLLLFRYAFEAECEARHVRADFFWRLAHDALRRAWPKATVWEAATGLAPGEAGAEDIRDATARELFLDAHAGFANAWLAQGEGNEPANRSSAHFDHMRRLIGPPGLSSSEIASVIGPSIDQQVDRLVTAKKWTAAVAAARSLFDLAPDDTAHQERLAKVLFAQATDQIDLSQASLNFINTKRLEDGFTHIQALRAAHSHNKVFYDLLGQLYQLHAISCANGDALAHSLVSSKRAQLYGPSSQATDQLLSDVVEAMNKRIEFVRQLEEDLRKSPGKSLNAEGRKIQADAKLGFSLLEQFMASEEPAQITASRDAAVARDVWRNAGLSPPEKDWDLSAKMLLDVMGNVYSSPAGSVDELVITSKNAAAGHPELAGVDFTKVAEFILRRRRENAGETVPKEPASASPVQSKAKALILQTVPPARRDHEPFLFWFFAPGYTGAKVVLVACTLVALASAAIGGASAWGEHVRDNAYAAMIDAAKADDDRTFLGEASAFLAARTVSPNDPRVAQVTLSSEGAVERPKQRQRDKAAASLRTALRSGDAIGVMNASEVFLGNVSAKAQDPREAIVRDVYAKTFARWFAQLRGDLDKATQSRIDEYKRLMVGTKEVRA